MSALELVVESDERYTPPALFASLNKEFGFTLDVCATPESAKCARYFTWEQNGLKKSWARERVFCNPPYSKIEPWVEKAWAEKEAELVVMLVPAWTDREWWHKHVEPWRDSNAAGVSTRFLRGRVRFGHPGNPTGDGVGSPPFWCCLLIWERP